MPDVDDTGCPASILTLKKFWINSRGMLFNSQQFLFFFLVVFAIYWVLPSHGRVRTFFLLAASYAFYMSWNVKLAAVVFISSLADFWIARTVQDSEKNSLRKGLLFASISMNLGLLFYFKYTNFFLDSLEALLNDVGLKTAFPTLSILLPIGISFYTFEAISYIVDVYKRRVTAERQVENFLLFIVFFPRMVAGPIIRARNFLPQINKVKRWNWLRMQTGIEYILLGLFKKLVIADRMACLVDPVFASPETYRTSTVWIAMFAYALQVYGDFSGYSDIAVGTGHLLGFRLPQNFNAPYAAPNISKFWRRWHISLATWLRDYVYIPLGGSQRTELRVNLNLLITMVLCGLWHGAAWTFVGFGAIQGFMLIVHRRFRKFAGAHESLKKVLETSPGTVLRIVLTFVLFSLSLVLFRAQTFPIAQKIFAGLFIHQNGLAIKDPVGPWSLVIGLVLTFIGYDIAQKKWWPEVSAKFPAPILGTAYALVVLITLLYTPEAGMTFIYFQF